MKSCIHRSLRLQLPRRVSVGVQNFSGSSRNALCTQFAQERYTLRPRKQESTVVRAPVPLVERHRCCFRAGVTFGLSLTPDAPTFHRARTLESSSIGLHPPNEELHFVTHGAAEMMVVVIDDSHLTTVLQGRFDMLPHDLSRTGRLRPRSGLAPFERAKGLAVILDTVLAKPDDKIIHQRAQECALELILRDIQPEPERSDLRDYSHVARRIEELLRAPRETPLTISQLCAFTGVPDRTLHLAFRKAISSCAPSGIILMPEPSVPRR
jgi:hypothetical protein